MSDGLEGGRQVFLGEAREILDELEAALLHMEESPDDSEPVGRVFRAMHTLKGSGAMFGFDGIASFTHELETYYDLVRSGRLRVTKELVDLTFMSLDQITAMLDACSGGPEPDEGKALEIVESLRKLAAGTGGEDEPAGYEAGEEPPVPPMEGGDVTYAIRFRPPGPVMQYGTNPLSLIAQLGALGECTVRADVSGIPPLHEIDPEMCYTGWDIVLTTRHCIEEVKDVFIFVDDDSDLSVKRVEGLCMTDLDFGHKLIGDLLVEKGEVTPEALRLALKEKKRIGEMLIEMGEISEDGLKTALAEQKALDARYREKDASSIRVASDKLDVLADLVGEMVTTQARLRRVAEQGENPELLSVTEEMDKLTEMLRDNTLSMRMVPIGTTFTKFKRLVRDLSRDLGKEVEFSTRGGETELDKTVIERLNDPIMHLIRNSIDHGIETPGERTSRGKRPSGTVSLSAAHAGGKVVIRIRDDGVGLDPDEIRRVAVEKGLIGPDERPADEELFNLTLAAGFSTTNSVSSVSGRGVGMDVVKKTMDALRGTVEISSTRGRGTEISLTLPLTLAIIEGLLVNVDEMSYVVPLNAAKSECMERSNRTAALGGVGDFMEVRGELVPCVRLREFFGLGGKPPEIEHVVVMEDEGWKAGIVVDRVVGGHQAVIKPLSRVCSSAEGVSGATILGDGGIALILDVADIVRTVQNRFGRTGMAA